MTLDDIRTTSDNKLAGSIRILLAVMFLMTGAMKLLVPMLAEAWSDQLLAANIPLYTISLWTVPFLEMALGAVLAVGMFVRPAAVVVIPDGPERDVGPRRTGTRVRGRVRCNEH